MDLTYKEDGSLPAGRQERIDTRLTKQFPYTRSFFHHIISRWGIQIKDKPVKKSHMLKNGEKIHVDDLQRYLWSEILEETPDIKIPIVREEEDYLISISPNESFLIRETCESLANRPS